MSDFATGPKIRGMGAYKPISNPNGRSFVVRKRPFASIIILDNFNGTGSLDAHTPDINIPGNSWVEDVGDWSVSGGDAIIGAESTSYATIDTGVSNYIIEGTIRVGALSANRGHLYRFLDNNDHWRTVLKVNQFLIEEVVQGVGVTVRASIAAPEIATFTTHKIKTICNGPSVTAILNDNKTISYGAAATQLTQTNIGMVSRNISDLQRDIQVSEL